MKTKVTRWPYLTAGVVMMLFAGIIYAWSILKAPLAAEFGWDGTALGLNYTITLSMFCIGCVLGGMLINKFSPRLITVFAGIAVCIGFTIASMLRGDISVLYLSYGGLLGLGIGVVYNAIISTVTSWYPDKRSTASGVLMMGFGASALFLGSVAGNLINSIGWRQTYFSLGIAVLIVFVIGSIFMKKPGDDVELPQPKKVEGAQTEVKDYSTAEMLKRASFWKFFLYCILAIAIGQCVISLAKDIALSVGAAETLAILLVGILSVCNGLGRVITGFLFDMIGRRKTMLIAGILTLTAPVLMLVAASSNSVPLVIAGLCNIGLAFGTLPPITTGFASAFYGSKYFPINFSIIGLSTIPASFAPTLAGVIVGSSGYVTLFEMLIAFGVLALIINLSIKKA